MNYDYEAARIRLEETLDRATERKNAMKITPVLSPYRAINPPRHAFMAIDRETHTVVDESGQETALEPQEAWELHSQIKATRNHNETTWLDVAGILLMVLVQIAAMAIGLFASLIYMFPALGELL
jgi:hypothetical protein